MTAKLEFLLPLRLLKMLHTTGSSNEEGIVNTAVGKKGENRGARRGGTYPIFVSSLWERDCRRHEGEG